MIPYWLILLIIASIILIILLLPFGRSARIAGAVSAAGIIIGSYTLYLASESQQRQLKLQEQQRNDQYFTDINKIFTEDRYKKDFEYIYGKEIDPDIFFLLSKISQAIENLNIQFEYSKGKRDDIIWLNIMKKWIQHPHFRKYWSLYKDYYDLDTNILVQQLLNNKI